MEGINNYTNGLGHIGIAAINITRTVSFLSDIGFEKISDAKSHSFPTVFMRMNDIVVEIYQADSLPSQPGSVEHVAISVSDIEASYRIMTEKGFKASENSIRFLPFWNNGVRFFTIIGPDYVKVEFCQYL